MKDMISEELLKEAIAIYMQKQGEKLLKEVGDNSTSETEKEK